MEEGVVKWITQEGGGTHTVEAYFVGAVQETTPGRSDKTETCPYLGNSRWLIWRWRRIADNLYAEARYPHSCYLVRIFSGQLGFC